MMLARTNLQQKLEGFRNKETSEEELLKQVHSLLKTRVGIEGQILKRIREPDPADANDFSLDFLETARIFHRTHIKRLCIEYRLRFLSTEYYKADLPVEALSEIEKLEKQHQTNLRGFRIVAPSSHFRLENADDPMLFAPIGNDYFYLIHKWGRDLHPFRRLLMWPFKNIENLLIFTIITSFLLTFVIRDVFFARFQSTSEFIMLYFITFKSMAGLIVFYGIGLGKNFSNAIWKSKYYNT